MLDVLFGIDTAERSPELVKSVHRMFDNRLISGGPFSWLTTVGMVSQFLKGASTFPSPTGYAIQRQARHIRKLVIDAYGDARSSPPNGQRCIAAGIDDVGGVERLKDDLVIAIVAGVESPAASVAWTLGRLLEHPEILQSVLNEINAGSGNDYLNAAICESLRLHPPSWFMPRRVSEDHELGPYRVPGGWLVVADVFVLQRDPELFDEPDVFRPERFLSVTRPKAWLPFGFGPHICPGAHLASLAMTAVLKGVLSTVDVELVSGPRATTNFGLTYPPANGAMIRVRRRL
jgi:cytochrome P450